MNVGETEEGVRKSVSVSVIVSGVSRGVISNQFFIFTILEVLSIDW